MFANMCWPTHITEVVYDMDILIDGPGVGRPDLARVSVSRSARNISRSCLNASPRACEINHTCPILCAAIQHALLAVECMERLRELHEQLALVPMPLWSIAGGIDTITEATPMGVEKGSARSSAIGPTTGRFSPSDLSDDESTR